MNENLAITIDIGTTNSKVSLFQVKNKVLKKRYRFRTPKIQDVFGELFDFDSLWNQLVHSMKELGELSSCNIDSIILSSVGEAGMLVDDAGNCQGPMIAWYDKRSAPYIERLSQNEKHRIYEITGLPAHSNYGISKIKWLIEHNLDEIDKKYTWMTIPDLIAYRLTGVMKTEFSVASRTMCYDIKERKWSDEILSMFDLKEYIRFPEVVKGGETISLVSNMMRKELGFACDVKVAIAGHDHMVGAHAVNLGEKQLLNSTGTTEGILYLDHRTHIDNDTCKNSLANGIYTNPYYYTLFSSIPTGGIAVEWLKSLFDINDEDFCRLIDDIYMKYTSNKLFTDGNIIVVPHLNGSGAPYKNTEAKVLSYGITSKTTKEDIVFGYILGLGLEFKHVVECFPMKEIEKVIVIGPVAKNELWLQIKADVLQREITAVQLNEAVSFGALNLVYPEYKSELSCKVYKPDKNKSDAYSRLFKLYQNLYKQKQLLECS